MENTNNLLTGLNVISQVPLNKKTYKLNEESLKDLGLDNNLAFTYHKRLEVTCIEEGTKYEWKEIEVGDVGLLPSNFIYPDGLIVEGIDYSLKEYNFVLIEPSVNQNNFVKQLFINYNDLPSNYDEQDIVNYILSLPEEERTVNETDSKWNVIIFESSS